jgi:hypothetical protein
MLKEQKLMDAKSKITPGPWHAFSGFAYQPAQVFGEELGRPVADVFGIDKDTRKANARAIAAVPDFISGIERALIEIDHAIENDNFVASNGRIGDAVRILKAALAKAGA